MSHPVGLECPNCSTAILPSFDTNKDTEIKCPNCGATIVAPRNGGKPFVKKSTSDKERATNRLLFALNQHPQGMTTQELVDFSNQQVSKEHVRQLLRDSGHVQEGYSKKGGSINMSAALWTLKKYVPGSAHDDK
jgi:ribosomal protein S27E